MNSFVRWIKSLFLSALKSLTIEMDYHFTSILKLIIMCGGESVVQPPYKNTKKKFGFAIPVRHSLTYKKQSGCLTFVL
jgi:hypothetical protein